MFACYLLVKFESVDQQHKMWVVIQLVVAAALLSDYSTAFAQQQLPRDVS